MTRLFFFTILLYLQGTAFAQSSKFYTINTDSTNFILTIDGGLQLSALPLKCIRQEYPNKTDHIASSDTDQLMTPSQMHPTFYGCFDWHSSVHGHWMLIRLLKEFPSITNAKEIREVISKNINTNNIKKEVQYFNGEHSKIFERTYGWAWLLKLQCDLSGWNDVDGKKWEQALQPLCDTIVKRWLQYLPKQTYPTRSGVHGNTAFGLVFALDYARTVGDTTFENAVINTAKRLYLKDKYSPGNWEPNGSDFLSPSLEEADLMRRILNKNEFTKWFHTWLPNTTLEHLTKLPIVSDRNDLAIVHLDGLCFSRAWCMKGIAKQLPQNDPTRKLLIRSAVNHLNTGLSSLTSSSYSGGHWLASYAIYAMLNE